MIVQKHNNGEWWWYLGSNCQGSIVIKYMGEYEFKLPNKLDAKGVYELVLGMETAMLVVMATPENAEIFIDNEKVGTGYASKSVSIGAEHRWKVQCTDYFPKEGVKIFTDRVEESINVELDPNFGYLTVVSDPAGAELYVDGKKVGITPYMFEHISRGQHRIEVKKEKYTPYVNVVNVKIGETIQFNDVKLEAVRVPVGSLEMTSNPTGAVITINGRQYGQTPKTLTDIEVGTYTVYFSKEGYQNLSQTIEIKDGKKETLAVTLTKTSVPQQQVPTTPVSTSGSSGGTSAATVSGNKTFTVNGVSFEMVAVKGGTFTMGCTPEQGRDYYGDAHPLHDVTLSDYYIGKFEVTQKLWKAIMEYNPSEDKGDNKPVTNVSYIECVEFIIRLNDNTGQTFSLPTEAEWEYAARGGNKSKGYVYSGSNNCDEVAWNTSSLHNVGTKKPNELGIYDMSGNVYEWCLDWYGRYSNEAQIDPKGPNSGKVHVFRGGGCSDDEHCRVSYRSYGGTNYTGGCLGFRLVLYP